MEIRAQLASGPGPGVGGFGGLGPARIPQSVDQAKYCLFVICGNSLLDEFAELVAGDAKGEGLRGIGLGSRTLASVKSRYLDAGRSILSAGSRPAKSLSTRCRLLLGTLPASLCPVS